MLKILVKRAWIWIVAIGCIRWVRVAVAWLCRIHGLFGYNHCLVVTFVSPGPPPSKIGLKVEKRHIITSVAHDGPICQDDNSATTGRQKKIRPAMASLAPPLSFTCVEIAVRNADQSRILKVSYLLQIWCTYTSS